MQPLKLCCIELYKTLLYISPTELYVYGTAAITLVNCGSWINVSKISPVVTLLLIQFRLVWSLEIQRGNSVTM